MNILNKIVGFLSGLPDRIWSNENSVWWVPYREAWHFAGGAAVALAGVWNFYVQLSFGAIMIGIILYKEIGDVKNGRPLWKSILDTFVWASGFAVVVLVQRLN